MCYSHYGCNMWVLSLQLKYDASEGGEYPLVILMETVDTISKCVIFVCVCVCVYVCVRACVYRYMGVCVRVFVCVGVGVGVCMWCVCHICDNIISLCRLCSSATDNCDNH